MAPSVAPSAAPSHAPATEDPAQVGLLQLQSTFVTGTAQAEEILLSTWLSPSSKVLTVAGYELPTANSSATLGTSFLAVVDLPAYSRLSPNAVTLFPQARTYMAAMWAAPSQPGRTVSSDMWMVSTDLTAVMSAENATSGANSTCSDHSPLLAGEACGACVCVYH